MGRAEKTNPKLPRRICREGRPGPPHSLGVSLYAMRAKEWHLLGTASDDFPQKGNPVIARRMWF